MYPAHYFSLFPAFPRQDTVFVAMSFDARFDRRWNEVIEPAIRAVRVRGVSQQPIRVDTRKISDSVLTEILSGIANCRLVFADITTIVRVDDQPLRNGNVMYEVGIAHASRLPEEVLLFRSDNDRLPFDVANVRVNSYSPDNAPQESKKRIAETIIEAMKEVDTRRHLAVRRAADALDFPSFWLLAQVQNQDLTHPEIKTMADALANMERVAAIRALLELGAIANTYLNMTPENFEELTTKFASALALSSYRTTPFGVAIFENVCERMGLADPRMQNFMNERIAKTGTVEKPV